MLSRRPVLGLLAAPFLLPAASSARAQGIAAARLPANPAGGFEALFRFDTTAPPALPVLPAGTARLLRIRHFNDLHNYLTTPHAVRGDTHAFGQMVRLVRAARAAAAEDEVVLFLSSGDDQTGGVLDELLGFSVADFVMHPAYAAYVAAGVDAAALGNHEFDRGTRLLAEAIERNWSLPLLSANIADREALVAGRHYHAALVGLAKGLRIGLMGLTTAEDTRAGTRENPGLSVESPLAALRRTLPSLAAASDVVLVLSHLGYGQGLDRSGRAGAERHIGEGDAAIAAACLELTDRPVVILGGHTHTVLNERELEPRNLLGGRVVVAQAGAHGSHLGEVTLRLVIGRDGAAARDIAVSLTALKRADRRVPADDPRAAQVQQDADVDQAFQGLVMAPMLARLNRRLADVIAQLELDDAVSTARTLADRYVAETAIANLMNDLMAARSGAALPDGPVDVAAFNATGLVAGIPANGPLTFADWFAVMPFTDSVQVFELTPAQLQAILDSNAQRIVRPEELAGPRPVDLNGYVSRGFLHFSRALRYRIALGASAAAARAVDVTLGGRPLVEIRERPIRVLFGSYIGNGGFAEAWNGRVIAGVPGEIRGFDLTALPKRDTGFVYRNEVVAQIRALGTLRPEHGARKDGRLVVSA